MPVAFRKGDQLRVRPHDYLDPEAVARAGQSCTFERYSRGVFGTPFAIVNFVDKKRVYLRDEDLEVVQGVPRQMEIGEVQS